jgi:hypothetical protein
VPNHTTDEHAWFQEALVAGRGSRERARYWLDSDGLHNTGLQIWRAWTQLPDGQWYLHMFDRKQPDLNWGNPEVRAMLLDVLRFWLDCDVDGFRVDVAQAVVKADGLPDFHGDLQAISNGTYPGERATVAEHGSIRRIDWPATFGPLPVDHGVWLALRYPEADAEVQRPSPIATSLANCVEGRRPGAKRGHAPTRRAPRADLSRVMRCDCVLYSQASHFGCRRHVNTDPLAAGRLLASAYRRARFRR